MIRGLLIFAALVALVMFGMVITGVDIPPEGD